VSKDLVVEGEFLLGVADLLEQHGRGAGAHRQQFGARRLLQRFVVFLELAGEDDGAVAVLRCERRPRCERLRQRRRGL